MISHRIILDFN
jgi:hypothetical protein